MHLRNLATCPNCRNQFYADVWQVLDFGREPDLRQKFLDGLINLLVCPNCGHTSYSDQQFLVIDPKCKRIIFFVEQVQGRPDPVGVALLRNVLPLALSDPNQYEEPRITGDWDELTRWVAEGAEQAAADRTEDEFDSQLELFCAAWEWEKKRDLLKTHPELLNDERTDPFLAMQIAFARREGNMEFELRLVLSRRFLRFARDRGIDNAYVAFSGEFPITFGPNSEPSIELPAEPQEFLDGDRVEDLERVEQKARADARKLPELIEVYEQALTWPVVAGDAKIFALVMLQLGIAYWQVGGANVAYRLNRAIECLNVALQFYTPEKDPRHDAEAQNQLGLVYLDLPTFDQTENLARAITCFRAALKIRTRENDPRGYAAAMNNLGRALSRLEDGNREENLKEATLCFQKALEFFTRQTDPVSFAKTQNNLGTVYYELSDSDPLNLDLAIECYQNTLHALDSDAGFEWLRAWTLINLGGAYHRLAGRDPATQGNEQAITCFKEALVILKREDFPRERAAAYEGLAAVYLEMPDQGPSSVISCYREAASLLDANTFPADLRRVAIALGDLCFSQEAWSDAVTAYREAIVANETLYRIAVTDASRHRELSQSQGVYSNRAFALARLGRYVDAVIQIEQGRAQILAETMSRDRVALDRMHPEDQADFATLRERIRELEAEARTLRSVGTNLADTPRFSQVSSDLRAARLDLADLTVRLRSYIPDLLSTATDIESIAASTGDRWPLVYLVTTTRGSLAIVVPPAVTALNEEHVVWLDAFRTYDAGEEPVVNFIAGQQSAAKRVLIDGLDHLLPILRDRITSPLTSRLTGLGFERARLIPCGLLALLPLHATFPDTWTVTFAPSARSLQAANAGTTRSTKPPVLMAIGNPLPSARPLRFARTEVETIAPLFGPGAGRVKVEGQATRAATLELLKGATHIHFACHGAFNIEEPLDSALFLSGEDRLTLQDLLDGDLDLSASRLAVLSACQTGVIESRKVPDEVVGFPAGFIQAGVAGVVSSLWMVNDVSTALLMIRFYRNLLELGQPAPEALHNAQIWLAESTRSELDGLLAELKAKATDAATRSAFADAEEKVLTSRPDAPYDHPYAHPYYWAPFVFYGL